MFESLEFGVSFWIKFALCFGLFVIVPIFFLDFTGTLSFFWKIMFVLGGGVGVVIALQGKSIKYGKNRR